MDRVKAARKGDEEAFLKLFDEHHLPVFRFAFRMTGSTADAEEIVQECFLALLHPGCRFDESRTPLRTYLFGAVRNQALKRMRHRDEPVADGPEPAGDLSPERDLLRTELQDVVAAAVARLPETQRAVLLLAHYEQMPLADIAATLEIEIGAVKSRLQRARAALKEMLAVYAPARRRIDE